MQEKKELRLCNLLFRFFFLNLAFLIFVWTRSNLSSAWYDNQILFCFYYYFFTTCLLRTTTHTIDGFSGCSTVFHVGIVLKGSSCGQMVVHVISIQRKDYGSKVFSRNGQFPFWSTCPKTSIKDDFEILWLVTCVFGYWNELAGLKL